MLYRIIYNNHFTEEKNVIKYLVPEVFQIFAGCLFIEILEIEIICKK